MQVSHVNEHITHAVIGGGKTIDFGISSSAEFFNILSSTLYKDQILAVAREVLCNAWDAHIEAGCTDKPVEVTITHDKLVIKDFGKGIQRDDMGPIYGVYGNSTKKNDGKQTGGFGLGCKAPFAYTDHFEVASTHDGLKTIYNLSKSSAQAQGKPGIVPIASFPSNDTGLQVSINIKNRNDYQRFHALIERIARNGDMQVMLNGGLVKPLGFDSSKSNYLITTEHVIDQQPQIMIRYGNVIYPVDLDEKISRYYTEIVAHLIKLKKHNSYYLILQAPPHSIAVTPSRESLSMQDHTVATLNTLFKEFMDTVNTQFQKVCNIYSEEVVQEAVDEVKVDALLSRDEKLPGQVKDFESGKICDLHSMARRYLINHYPNSVQFRKQDIRCRLTKMVAAGLLNRGIVQTYLRELDTVEGRNKNYSNTTWLQRRVIAPLVTKMVNAGLDPDRLYVVDPEDSHAPDRWNQKKGGQPLVQATKACPKHPFNVLPYLRNIVVLTLAKTDLHNRCMEHKVFKELGAYSGYMFYHVGMKKQDKQIALDFFKASGMEVVDLTQSQSTVSRGDAPRKPVKKGLALLSSVIHPMSKKLDTPLSRGDAVALIMEPEFVVHIPINRNTCSRELPGWDMTSSQYVVELFGDKGGITVSEPMHQKWLEKGMQNFAPYVQGKVLDYVLNNPRIKEYWAFKCSRVCALAGDYEYTLHKLLKLIYKQPVLRAQFGLVNNLTEEDRKYIHLFDVLWDKNRYRTDAPVTAASAQMKAIPLDPVNTELLSKLKGNSLLSIIDMDELVTFLESADSTQLQIDKALSILSTVLNP